MNDAHEAITAPYSVRHQSEAFPSKLWFSVAAALAGSLQFGYGYGVLNTALDEIGDSVGYSNEAVLNSAVVLGSAIGAITAGVFADHVGPRRAQMYNVLAYLLGAVLTAIAVDSPTTFLVGRVITGFGAGASSLYAPRYIAEIAPLELRGRLVSQCQVFVNLGILAAYCVGIPYGTDNTWYTPVVWYGYTILWWQWMIIFALVPAMLQFVLLLGSPESPMWLESRDKELADEACIQLWGSRAILYEALPGDTEHCGGARTGLAAALLHTSPFDPKDPSSPPVLVELKPATGGQEGWRDLRRYQYRWMLALAVGLPLLQQACGVNTVILYSSGVFKDSGLEDPIWGSIGMGAVNLGFTIVASSLMDRWGRRPLLLLSYAGMSLSLFAVALHSSLTQAVGAAASALPSFAPPAGADPEGSCGAVNHAGAQAKVTAALLVLYVLFFALGAGPVTALYLSEILPKRIKGKAAALANCLAWMSNLTVALTFCPLMNGLHLGGTYLIYGLFNVLALVYLFVLMPETKCRSWREIEAMLLLAPKPKLRTMMRGASSLSSPLLGSGSLLHISTENSLGADVGGPGGGLVKSNGVANGSGPYQNGFGNGVVGNHYHKAGSASLSE